MYWFDEAEDRWSGGGGQGSCGRRSGHSLQHRVHGQYDAGVNGPEAAQRMRSGGFAGLIVGGPDVIAAGRRGAAADFQKVALIVLPVCGSNHVRLIRGKVCGRGYGMYLCLELFYLHTPGTVFKNAI